MLAMLAFVAFSTASAATDCGEGYTMYVGDSPGYGWSPSDALRLYAYA